MQIDLYLAGSNSLKAKRAVLTSLKKRIANKHNVSVSEIDNLDKWQRATLGVSTVSNDRKVVDKTLDALLHLIDRESEMEALEYSIEVF